MKQEIAIEDRKLRKQINLKCNNIGSADEIKCNKYYCSRS
jgi:hypothetical protein